MSLQQQSVQNNSINLNNCDDMTDTLAHLPKTTSCKTLPILAIKNAEKHDRWTINSHFHSSQYSQ